MSAIDKAHRIFDELVAHPKAIFVQTRKGSKTGNDGCWYLSGLGRDIISKTGAEPYELVFKLRSNKDFHPMLADGNPLSSLVDGAVWSLHVVAGATINGINYVFDPVLCDGPVTDSDYRDIMAQSGQMRVDVHRGARCFAVANESVRLGESNNNEGLEVLRGLHLEPHGPLPLGTF